MVLDINFNNPHILRGCVDQAVQQKGLEDVSERFLIGSCGGLAYALYGVEIKDKTLPRIVTYGCVVDGLINFGKAIEQYEIRAEEIAKDSGFKELGIRSDDSFWEEPPREVDLYSAAIGAVDIVSKERFEDFITMIAAGKDELTILYRQVVTAANALSWLDPQECGLEFQLSVLAVE